jgi:probable F420-dependent oxidoreductase
MRYGLSIPQIGRLADPQAIRTVAVAADEAGYSSLWALDRVLAPVEPRTPYPATPDGVLPPEQTTVLDPIGVLTLAASVTERIRVGTNVLVAPWYPAVLLARSLTILDHLSAGRLTVGLGLGWSVDEYEAVGVAQEGLGAKAEELLDVLDAVWTTDIVKHRGERYHIAPSTILPKPKQDPRPPLLLAAYTPAGLDRIARRADGWTPAGLPVAAVGPMWSSIRERAEQYGRQADALQLVVRANIKLSDTPLSDDRPSYWGSLAQIQGDLGRTWDAGADEIILDLPTCATAEELLELAAALVSPSSDTSYLRRMPPSTKTFSPVM